MTTKQFDVVVIGAGQAGLSVGYYLKRAGLDFIMLDNQETSGGAWLHTWPSLRLFSPAPMSSLPGRLMPKATEGEYPHRSEVLSYLADYEQHYQLPIYRPHQVQTVVRDNDALRVSDGKYSWLALPVPGVMKKFPISKDKTHISVNNAIQHTIKAQKHTKESEFL
ncbi:FAD-dependent oxidoreductase [Marinomonas algicola]|uniref:FAD-dependent oxidoreductase n=1 Tax=Marinomonas algicola TaxID=2773454 RepID=UPI0019D5907F|nr:FAD-dependent oxidoreductase [Marinomonas algicola]